jgi:nucleoid-associated protein YgaU
MSRTHVRRRRIALAFAVSAVAAAWAGPAVSALGADRQPVAVSTFTYVVREGDTLWSIAETLAPGQDPRPVVDRLASVNGLDPSLLVPGQTLVVPSSV